MQHCQLLPSNLRILSMNKFQIQMFPMAELSIASCMPTQHKVDSMPLQSFTVR